MAFTARRIIDLMLTTVILRVAISDCLFSKSFEWRPMSNCTYRFMMARGQQKIQSQQKNAAKQAKLKKGAGGDQKAAAKKALIYTCPVCRTQMPDPKTYRQHFESKHPKQPLPPELQGAGV